tara:strand:- start:1700 stop:1960 length:261 start_codon:yes stop_codon:yes gene_type:complete
VRDRSASLFSEHASVLSQGCHDRWRFSLWPAVAAHDAAVGFSPAKDRRRTLNNISFDCCHYLALKVKAMKSIDACNDGITESPRIG